MDKTDELRLSPLSLSWYHSDVVKIISPLLEGSASVDVVCAGLRALQLRKYATALDTASGIAVLVLSRADNSTDAKSALASVTKLTQLIHGVMTKFVADDGCMLAFVTHMVSGVAGGRDARAFPPPLILFLTLFGCCRNAQNAACSRSNIASYVSRRRPFGVRALDNLRCAQFSLAYLFSSQ